MKPEVAKQLLELNHQFYQTFAGEFSLTRQRIQPGVERILETLPSQARLLDLGCGNGALAERLSQRGHTGTYLGLDISEKLVKIARKMKLPKTKFIQGDLADPDWDSKLIKPPFDFIFCFAVMHHIPGEDLRIRFLEKVRSLLAPDGRFIHSNWQFLDSQRLRARIQPWERIDLTDTDVDEGDYLLDWRRGGEGLRYVHYFSSSELHALAVRTGFRVGGLFTSDGEGSRLGLYQIWEVSG
jgi:tRNA (uracil-5-)-methyltransferase TRM9